jgi:hypothetical protein
MLMSRHMIENNHIRQVRLRMTSVKLWQNSNT